MILFIRYNVSIINQAMKNQKYNWVSEPRYLDREEPYQRLDKGECPTLGPWTRTQPMTTTVPGYERNFICVLYVVLN